MSERRTRNRAFVLGLVSGLVVGAGATAAWFLLRPKPEEQAGPGLVPTPDPDGKLEKARLGCKNLAQAIESFTLNAANPEQTPPNPLTELVSPPFGGPSFLRNGVADLTDPWGGRYQSTMKVRPDGTTYPLVWTIAPDGAPINQFGVGRGSGWP